MMWRAASLSDRVEFHSMLLLQTRLHRKGHFAHAEAEGWRNSEKQHLGSRNFDSCGQKLPPLGAGSERAGPELWESAWSGGGVSTPENLSQDPSPPRVTSSDHTQGPPRKALGVQKLPNSPSQTTGEGKEEAFP